MSPPLYAEPVWVTSGPAGSVCTCCHLPFHVDTVPVVGPVVVDGRHLVRVDLGQNCSGLAHFSREKAEELSRTLINSGVMPTPIPMLLWCPGCGARHVDEGEWATRIHSTHACQSCGMVWRQAVVATVGVQFLPGFKNNLGDEICVAIERVGERLSQVIGAAQERGAR